MTVNRDATKEERIKAAIMRHPDWNDQRVSNCLSRYRVLLREVIAVREGKSLLEGSGPKPESGIVSLSKVLEKYDTQLAIAKELKSLQRGKLIIESELCLRTAGRDKTRFRRCVENNSEEFKPFRLKLRLDESGDGKWYWGHPEDVAEAQRKRDE